MIDDVMRAAIHRELFSESDVSVFAVLDGASIEGLLGRLESEAVEHACLFSGDLAPDHAAAAPYLVRLPAESEFTDWVIGEGWGDHWGIFVTATVELRRLRKHFRTFLMVRSPSGEAVYFRYYDPRVLRVYLPTLNAQEMEQIFGPVRSYALEGEDANILLRFWTGDFATRCDTLPLAAVPA